MQARQRAGVCLEDARLAQLEEQLQLSGGAEEKEQLDALLHEYLQTKPGSF